MNKFKLYQINEELKNTGIMKWYLKVLKNYAVFNGRAGREEFWMFTLFNFAFLLVAAITDNIMGITFDHHYFDHHINLSGFEFTISPLRYGVSPNGFVYLIYSLAVLIPGLAVLIRRIHDAGKSGWFALVPVYNLILICTRGTKGDNKYGAEPKSFA